MGLREVGLVVIYRKGEMRGKFVISRWFRFSLFLLFRGKIIKGKKKTLELLQNLFSYLAHFIDTLIFS